MSEEKKEYLTVETLKVKLKHIATISDFNKFMFVINEFSNQQTKALREENEKQLKFIDKCGDEIAQLQSELTQVKEHNKQLAEALSQQEPIKGVEELKAEWLKYSEREILADISLHDENKIFNWFLPHLRTSNTQSETWKEIYKKYMLEYPDYYSKHCEKPLPQWLEENYISPIQNSKGI